MFRLICVLVFVAFNGAVAQSDCVPDSVHNITLSSNYTLSWTPSLNCDNTDYIIYVHSEFELDHIYQISSTSLDVSFLPACEKYRFIVIAHTNNTASEQNYTDALIPAPPEADLAITYFNVTQNGDAILFDWSVNTQYEHCAHYYRLEIVDYQIRDVYVEDTHFLLKDFTPCMEYFFSLRAIYNLEIEGPSTIFHLAAAEAATHAPSVISVIPERYAVNITWELPEFTVNACHITSLYVDGPFYTEEFQMNDSPQRPQFTTRLSTLRQDTMYFLQVYVMNSAGLSDPFQLGVQTLA